MTTQAMALAAEFKMTASIARLDTWDAPTAKGVDIEATTIVLDMDLTPAKWLVLTFVEVATGNAWDSKWIDVENLKTGDRVRTQSLAAGETVIDIVDMATGTIKADDLSGGSIALVHAETWATSELGVAIPFGSGGSAARVTYSTGAPTTLGAEGDVHAATHDGTASGTVFAFWVFDADQNRWIELSLPEVVTVAASRALLPTDYGKTLLVGAGVTLSIPPLATISPVGVPYFLTRVRFTGATNAVPATIALAAGNTATTSFVAPYGATLVLTGEERVIEMSGATAWVS